jgi:hypothetical protein
MATWNQDLIPLPIPPTPEPAQFHLLRLFQLGFNEPKPELPIPKNQSSYLASTGFVILHRMPVMVVLLVMHPMHLSKVMFDA